jgi:hypothetical protein
MTVTVKIKTDTPTGKRLENELRQYPQVVEFVDINIVSDTHPDGYSSRIEAFRQVSTSIQIKADTEIGLALVRKLESYPKFAKIEYPFPLDNHGNEIETISVVESARLAFERLGEKYNCKFENKYTR